MEWLRLALALCCVLAPRVMSRAQAQRSGQERRIDTPLGELLPRVLAGPQVAFGGDQYLVVWIDQRLGGGAQQINQLLGARVTPEGRVLDSRGFAIATTAGLRREPRVVRSDQGFIVMWRESRMSGNETPRFARVDHDGHVLDPDGISLPLYAAQELDCAGSACLTASAESQVLGFDTCGKTGPTVALTIPPRTSGQSGATATAARIRSDACGHFLAFGQRDERSGDVSVVLSGFDLDGGMRFGRVVQHLPMGTSVLPALDFAPNAEGELLLVWQQQSDAAHDAAQPTNELWSLRLDQSGQAVSEARRLMEGTSPALAFADDAYVLVTGSDTLSAFVLESDGSLRAPEPVVIRAAPAGLRGPARVAAGPDGALVVWDLNSTPIQNELNAARLDAHGKLLDPEGLSIAASANRQQAPQLATDGQGYLLVFRDDRPDRAGILQIHFDAQGLPLTQSAPAFEAALDDRATPQLFQAGDAHALVWSEGEDQFVSWLDPDTHIAGAQILLPASVPKARPSMRFVPGDASILALGQPAGLLCGEDQACDLALSVQVLHADATADSAMPATLFGPDGEWARSTPIATSDGHGFVVAFTQERVEAHPIESSLRVLHVEADGSATGEPRVVTSTPERSIDEALAIVPGNDGYLLVFARRDPASEPQNRTLFALRLAADLSARDPEPLPIAMPNAEHSHASAAYDGEAWLVVWQERTEDNSWDIRGARVTAEPGDAPSLFAVAASPFDELNPVLAAIDARHALVAYERFDTDPKVMTGRVFLRDLMVDARCADPDCCDGECRPPAAASCKAMPHDTKACTERLLPTHHARYDCGCHALTGGRVPHGAGALGGLILMCVVRVRRRRAARQRAQVADLPS